jgi:hypothetical protein
VFMQSKGSSRIVTTMTRGHQADDAIAPTAQAVQSFELRLVAGGNHGSEACWLFRFAAFTSRTRGPPDGSLKIRIYFVVPAATLGRRAGRVELARAPRRNYGDSRARVLDP